MRLAQNATAQQHMNFRNKAYNEVPNLTIDSDTMEGDPEEAEAMEDYFSEIFTQESSLLAASALSSSEEYRIDSVDVDKYIVLNSLKKLY
ncbi:unnamed protein product [Trichobilharzia regenti]|nr:unnamed protein product [Trichobilharzia regenti]